MAADTETKGKDTMSTAKTTAPAPAIVIDEATERGVQHLIDKAAPLLQGQRFDNVIDLLSLLSDAVDMSDDAMIQKLMKVYEEGVGAAWTLGNAARYAGAQAAHTPPPSLLGLVRAAGDEDVRRGLHFAIRFLGVLGRHMKDDGAA
ncbi:Protein of uncharacterised function (DUF1641) [Brevundimonas vancanneytii]|uniref:Protein of uncharacterized function (DUF1641) n=2 Tax=Caulobacteraceae TaxID=76892 RepID=A0A4P1KEU2_9CAUL|nr:Protein of uncharacterised function (DUF1641) [Brevundimonas vancanneytii]